MSLSSKCVKEGSKGNIVITYALDLHDSVAVRIRTNTRNGILFIESSRGYDKDSVGLLGSHGDDRLLSHDGTFDMSNNWNSFAGEEWQATTETDPMLFKERRILPVSIQ